METRSEYPLTHDAGEANFARGEWNLCTWEIVETFFVLFPAMSLVTMALRLLGVRPHVQFFFLHQLLYLRVILFLLHTFFLVAGKSWTKYYLATKFQGQFKYVMYVITKSKKKKSTLNYRKSLNRKFHFRCIRVNVEISKKMILALYTPIFLITENTPGQCDPIHFLIVYHFTITHPIIFKKWKKFRMFFTYCRINSCNLNVSLKLFTHRKKFIKKIHQKFFFCKKQFKKNIIIFKLL